MRMTNGAATGLSVVKAFRHTVAAIEKRGGNRQFADHFKGSKTRQQGLRVARAQ